MSQLRHKLKPLLITLLAAALLFSLVGPAWAQNGDTDGEPVETQDEALTCDHPVLASLIQEMAEASFEPDEEVDEAALEAALEAACAALNPYLDVGVGQIMKAWYLSQTFSDYVITDPTKATAWEDLLARHREGQGWGEVMFAYRFAEALAEQAGAESVTPTGQELLDLKTVDGFGWGEIAKLQAIVGTGEVSLQDAKTMIQSGKGWGELREEFGLEPGPPPWRGRPPWAGGPKKNDVDDENLENGESSGSGAPAFSGPPGQNRGNGKGPGKGKGGGNGNAYGHNK